MVGVKCHIVTHHGTTHDLRRPEEQKKKKDGTSSSFANGVPPNSVYICVELVAGRELLRRQVVQDEIGTFQLLS